MPPTSVLELRAPVNGILVPLDAVPDPVFAGRMTGDGVAIEPLSAEFVAPCDARVLHVHRAGHAITLEAGGVELLLHIGLDTVQLLGEGFTPLVRAGDLVTVGTPLIRIDADRVSRAARSLITPLLVTNMESVASLEASTGTVVAGRDVVLRITITGVSATAEPRTVPASHNQSAPLRAQASFRVVAESGLHARPAASLAAAARLHTAEVKLEKGVRMANVRSVVAMLSLEVECGDVVTVGTEGDDAVVALRTITDVLLAGLAIEMPEAKTRDSGIGREPVIVPESGSQLRGVSAAPGSVAGTTVVRRYREISDDLGAAVGTPDEERAQLARAVAGAHHDLALLRHTIAQHDAQHAEIFAAHQALLADPELLSAVEDRIARGLAARSAWREVYVEAALSLEALHNPLLSARAADLHDVGRRVLSLLQGEPSVSQRWPAGTILIADELTPSDIVSLDRDCVVGLATTSGSATSHVAILARGLLLPLLVAVPQEALLVADGTRVWLHADDGVLHVDPDEQTVDRLRARAAQTSARQERERTAAHLPALTRDNHLIEVTANIGSVADATQCVLFGADGIGLLRSEFAFVHRRTAPDEDTQTALYASAAQALAAGQTLVIRTLDVGGDKPMPFLPIPPESNPFLGVRGIRLTLAYPDVMRTQVRAILRASTSGNIAIMFPMISSLAEWRAACALVEQERVALQLPPIPTGIMVETAAAALLAETFARDADFLSIGTNDLTQYTLAMDRTHPQLAAQVDALHPAVLQLVAHTVRGASTHNRPVSVCGTIAADMHAIPVLLGLGVHKLSVDLPLVPSVKWRVRSLDLGQCRETARLALTLGDGAAARDLVEARHAIDDSDEIARDSV